MPIGTSSYTWRTPTEPEATVFHAAELKHRRVHPSGELRHRLWVLDYNYTPGERVRVHSVSAPGWKRPRGCAHCMRRGPVLGGVGGMARQDSSTVPLCSLTIPGFFGSGRLCSASPEGMRVFSMRRAVGTLLGGSGARGV